MKCVLRPPATVSIPVAVVMCCVCCCVQFHVAGRAPVFAYSNAFCEGGQNGTGLYYLASAGKMRAAALYVWQEVQGQPQLHEGTSCRALSECWTGVSHIRYDGPHAWQQASTSLPTTKHSAHVPEPGA